MKNIFADLEEICGRPEPFRYCTAADLWTDGHISGKMLEYHLNPDIDVSSRRVRFIKRSVEWMYSSFNINRSTRIADFGCGPGLYTNRLAKLGARVTGVDFSRRSIEFARQEARKSGLSVEYIVQDYLDFETEDRFDLILMIMCDFCALSPAQRMSMLCKFASLLSPGGSVILDVYSLNAFDQRSEANSFAPNLMDGFWSAEKYYGFHNTFVYEDVKVVLDKYTIIQSGAVRTIYNWLQYFSPASLRDEFQEAGFSRLDLCGDVAGRQFHGATTEFAIIAGIE